MSVSEGDIAHALELLSSLDGLSARRMMGGCSIYCAGRIFAMLDREGVLYLKAAGDFAQTLQAAGARQFGAGTSHRMGYWTMPEAGLDDPEVAGNWASAALENL